MSVKILALGDSWFHYPYGLSDKGEILIDPKGKGVGNILKHLLLNHPELSKILYYDETTTSQFINGTTHSVISTDDVLGCCGEELLIMVNGDGTAGATTWLQLLISRIQHYINDADTFIILLSGGGNDIAAEHLDSFLLTSGDNVAQNKISDTVDARLKKAYQQIIDTVCQTYPVKKFHFIMHGYAYAPVNGNGVFQEGHDSIEDILQKLKIGPWLYPSFWRFGLLDNTLNNEPYCEDIIAHFIAMFNDMVSTLQAGYPNGKTYYIDLRGLAQIHDSTGWCNELHFSSQAFPKAAELFYNTIVQIFNTIGEQLPQNV